MRDWCAEMTWCDLQVNLKNNCLGSCAGVMYYIDIVLVVFRGLACIVPCLVKFSTCWLCSACACAFGDNKVMSAGTSVNPVMLSVRNTWPNLYTPACQLLEDAGSRVAADVMHGWVSSS